MCARTSRPIEYVANWTSHKVNDLNGHKLLRFSLACCPDYNHTIDNQKVNEKYYDANPNSALSPP